MVQPLVKKPANARLISSFLAFNYRAMAMAAAYSYHRQKDKGESDW